MSCNEIQHGATSAVAPLSVSVGGSLASADALPTITDIIGADGNSLGTGPNFGLNGPPVVTQDTDAANVVIPGAYRVTFPGLAANGGTFQGGQQFRILWSATVAGSTFTSSTCATVSAPDVQLGGCC